MLYCPRCNKQVDFNSTSTSRVTGAYTIDLQGPVDPTVVRSETKIVNVCKNCGCTDLERTKQTYLNKRAANQREIDAEDRFCKIFGILCLFLGVATTIFLVANGMWGLEALGCGAVVAIGLFLIGFIIRAVNENS